LRATILTPDDFEVEYDNRRRFPEAAAIAARWGGVSAGYRNTARAELDISYGPGSRHRYDLFFGGPVDAPLVVYIHGGYWQWGDRGIYSFVAEALNARGVNVALPSYSLCPPVSIKDIITELRVCLSVIWNKTRSHPLVVGHSAGGHLTSALLATDWRAFPGLPPDLVSAGVAISGIFDLQPTELASAVG
jgi:arylformamidase